LSFFIVATARGELADAWNWSDVPPPSSEQHKGTEEKSLVAVGEEATSAGPNGDTVHNTKLQGNGTAPVEEKEKSM